MCICYTSIDIYQPELCSIKIFWYKIFYSDILNRHCPSGLIGGSGTGLFPVISLTFPSNFFANPSLRYLGCTKIYSIAPVGLKRTNPNVVLGLVKVITPSVIVVSYSKSDVLFCSVCIKCFLKLACMAAFGLGQGFKPVSNLVKTFVTCCFSHAWVHVCILVCFTRDSTF